jgi:hypothetical protein
VTFIAAHPSGDIAGGQNTVQRMFPALAIGATENVFTAERSSFEPVEAAERGLDGTKGWVKKTNTSLKHRSGSGVHSIRFRPRTGTAGDRDKDHG